MRIGLPFIIPISTPIYEHAYPPNCSRTKIIIRCPVYVNFGT
ncbi:hypothetical protein CBM2592_A60062 [Cupriavidus taiwanensis]|nr:hypothetical protein CBM2592_A60062 [Cupriavidus taiwanensis]SOZ81403.1 hypothetical protein CBM2618_A50063 [Cupriavidus taiwanensis]SPA29683.1 hypothetical protein CBM2623_A60031 [Cupriavidus taiwanensis]